MSTYTNRSKDRARTLDRKTIRRAKYNNPADAIAIGGAL